MTKLDASERQWVPAQRFQILALDGGGVRGLFSVEVLAQLEATLRVQIADFFDLVTGTSTGGIIALALGAGVAPREVADQYRKLAASVFPRYRRWNPARVNRPTYNQDVLRDALYELFGERLLGESQKRLVIPAWDLRNRQVHVFKTRHHPRLATDWRIPMVDVALATTAAPTYFPVAKLPSGGPYIDGGVWAVNPTAVAITEAVSMLDQPLDAIRALNIGTTTAVSKYPPTLDRAGVLRWGLKVPRLFLTASDQGTRGMAEHLLGRDDYIRFDVDVPQGIYSLDRGSPDELTSAAQAGARRLVEKFEARFADHRAERFDPLPPPRAEEGAS